MMKSANEKGEAMTMGKRKYTKRTKDTKIKEETIQEKEMFLDIVLPAFLETVLPPGTFSKDELKTKKRTDIFKNAEFFLAKNFKDKEEARQKGIALDSVKHYEACYDIIEDEIEILSCRGEYILCLRLFVEWADEFLNDVIETSLKLGNADIQKEDLEKIKNFNLYSKTSWVVSSFNLPQFCENCMEAIKKIASKQSEINKKRWITPTDKAEPENRLYKNLFMETSTLIFEFKKYMEKIEFSKMKKEAKEIKAKTRWLKV